MHYFVCYIEVDELGNHYSGQINFLQLTGVKLNLRNSCLK